MRKVLFFIIMAVILNTEASFAFSTKGQDCSKCHSLKKEEAVDILKDMIPNIKVKNVRTSPVKSMWEVEFEADTNKGLIYIDFSKKYALSGAILDIKAKKNLTQDRYADINRVDVSKIPLKDALLLGNKSAKTRVIVFTDPDCPFCVKLHAEMKKVVAERQDVAFLIKMFPLPMHKEAYEKAKAIVCEKSLQMLEDAFEKKPVPKAKCKTPVIDQNIALAKKLGINGTPALIMPNGKVSSGFKDAAAIKEMIDKK
jgi:thiol:disulfide interchange protein DsbC